MHWGPLALALLASSSSHSAGAASAPSCERFALHDLVPGMTYDRVRKKMGREGMTSLTRLLGDRETSVTIYRDSSFDVYVEYDHRIDRRPAARAVLVRAAMPLLPTSVESLVARFGVPDDGAADLAEGLHDGVAVWVDEPCGIALTAYRPPASWWAGEGGTTLQLETLNLALKGGSPGSSKVSAVLERKHGSAASEPPSPAIEVVAYWVEGNGTPPVTDEASSRVLPAVSEVPSPVAEPVAEEVEEASSIATDVPPASELPRRRRNPSRTRSKRTVYSR